MVRFLFIALGALCIPIVGAAQSATADAVAVEGPSSGASTGSISAEVRTLRPEFVPMTASERARKYIVGAFGPGALLRAAVGGGIAQSSPSPREWGGGARAYGDRVGDVLAKHVIREALEFGGSAALREDNRYVRSTQTGFFKRSTDVVESIFVVRNDAGAEHFAYSRFGAVLGSSFLSRLWQPQSHDGAGDAAVSFGLTIVSDLGWNYFKEFCPRGLKRHFGAH